MRIVYLLESAAEPWGGVQTVLRDAQALQERGHRVQVVSRDGPPPWRECPFPVLRDGSLTLEEVEPADLVVGTFWTTVLPAFTSGKGKAVHFCQGFEDDPSLPGEVRESIDAVYRLKETEKIVVSSHLADLIRKRYGLPSRVVPNAVDERVMFPLSGKRREGPPRVGLVGPAQIPIKGISTGFGACVLAHRAGLDLVLVRASHMPILEAEFRAPFPVEAYRDLPYEKMGDFYRSLDVFLGTAVSENEGFYLPGLEALACGIPSILTDIPCVRSYAKGGAALLVPPGDPQGMAAALLLLGRREEVRAGLREAGPRAARSFSMEARMELLERTFLEITEEAESHLSLFPIP